MILTRQTVFDYYDLSDYEYTDISIVIKKLIELHDEGYTKVDIEAEIDGYGCPRAKFKVTRTRLESDDEYATRMAFVEAQRERRRQEYLKLKAEFEAN
jgi:hypothetical protein